MKRENTATTTHRCSICKKFYQGFGNNAQPINNGRCCDDCNADTVIPERIARIYAAKGEVR
jgi:hypothetical protein